MVHKRISTLMVGLYFHKSFLLKMGCLETVYINNQTILYFFDLFYKEDLINISYTIIVNQNDVNWS